MAPAIRSFRKKGDILLLVSPSVIQIYVANPEAIYQITAQREAFPKPLENYRILDVFGRNVITAEGGEWRLYRKISSPSFKEKNNALVFSEACSQGQGMLGKWLKTSGSATIEDVPVDVMRLTLHIISRVGFGVRLLWSGEKPDEKESAQDAVFSSSDPSEGHSMNYEDNLDTLLSHLIWVVLTPKWLLSKLRFVQGQSRN